MKKDESYGGEDGVTIEPMSGGATQLHGGSSWQSLFDSLDRFSDDFMDAREQPILTPRENTFE